MCGEHMCFGHIVPSATLTKTTLVLLSFWTTIHTYVCQYDQLVLQGTLLHVVVNGAQSGFVKNKIQSL